MIAMLRRMFFNAMMQQVSVFLTSIFFAILGYAVSGSSVVSTGCGIIAGVFAAIYQVCTEHSVLERAEYQLKKEWEVFKPVIRETFDFPSPEAFHLKIPFEIGESTKRGTFCFIVYSYKDRELAKRLHTDLEAHGEHCSFAPIYEPFAPFHKLGERRFRALNEGTDTRMLLILSPNSIHTKWLESAIIKTRECEIKEQRRLLFPVLMGVPSRQFWTMKHFSNRLSGSLARQFGPYHVPDFSMWRSHDSYLKELAKLLKALKSTSEYRPL